MSAFPQQPATPEAFLAWEAEQDRRWEFDGTAAMLRPGGTLAQALIVANLVAGLARALAGSGWAVLGGGVKVAAGHSIRYPDASVVRLPFSPRATIVQVPVVVFEVLGAELAATALTAKIRAYEASPFLRRYVVLEQDRIAATVFARESGGWRGWLLGGGEVLALPEIGTSLPLASLYAGLDLPAPPGDQARSGLGWHYPISVIVRPLREAIERRLSFRHGGFTMARRTVVQKPAAPARNRQPLETADEVFEETVEAPVEPAAPVPFVVALDVGYSNLKMLAGARGGTPVAKVLPAGAGPATAMSQQASGLGRRGDQDGLQVRVDGTPWAAGVEPSRLQNRVRELHEDYPATDGYRALVYAALLVAGPERIDTLVTGLPVSQWLDPVQREALRVRLTGSHAVTPARSVEVVDVEILPQPHGAYLDFKATEPDTVAEARVLVVDAGFFSVDWVLYDEDDMRAANSGTSTAAMSRVLEAAADLILDDHGSRIEREQLERAVRAGRDSVLLFGRPVRLAPYLEEAAKQTAPVAVTAIRQSLRGEGREVDLVLLTGGGAATYAEATKAVFPRARVEVLPEPVLANARGFWLEANGAAA